MELTQAMEDIKMIQACGGQLGEREAALLKTANGPLLSGTETAANPHAPGCQNDETRGGVGGGSRDTHGHRSMRDGRG